MAFGGWKAAELLVHVDHGDLASFLGVQSLDHFCSKRCHGDDGGAGFGLEGGLRDDSVVDGYVEGQAIAAAPVGALPDESVGEGAVVTRLANVIPEEGGVHFSDSPFLLVGPRS